MVMEGCGNFTIYLSDSGDEDERNKSKRIIERLEGSNIGIIYGERDFIPGCLILDNKRNAVLKSDLVVVLLSDSFIDSTECVYDVALAICLERHIIVIDNRKTRKMPPLLNELPKINGRTNFVKVLQKLKRMIDGYYVEEKNQTRNKKDDAQIYIREVERTATLENEQGFQKQILRLQVQLTQIHRDKKIAKHIAIVDGDKAIDNFHHEQTIRYQLEKRIREMENTIQTLRRENILLKHPVISVSQMDDKPSQQTPFQEIQKQINQVLIEISNLSHKGVDNLDTTFYRMPSELKSFCQKYEEMIGPNICRLGRLLHLSNHQIEKVEECREYGYVEMFWQTIKFWQSNESSDESFVTLLNALEEIGVDIGGKPMSKTQVRILHEKIPFILNNIYQVTDLIPYLISQHVLTHVTEMFIREPRNKEERLLRLINVLTTKHYGIKALCNALTHTNQKFIADDISRSMPNISTSRFPVEVTDESCDSQWSSDESKLQVARVTPITATVNSANANVHFEQNHQCQNIDSSITCVDGIEQLTKKDSNDKTRKSRKGCSIQ
ncbi:uncharacterized protein LOC127724077 [Mytilus californianus]|uniref:uncharacterized protein LOC127724077 n=1 Tax=Mytilus californianus TaxID=6549 RepID=UPI002246F1E9|nr:uncharacterized protein LOC127724077 [Mytilus californianus]